MNKLNRIIDKVMECHKYPMGLSLDVLHRLAYGDLSHIGNAILEGEEVVYRGDCVSSNWRAFNFVGAKADYALIKPEFYVGGIKLKIPPLKLEGMVDGQEYFTSVGIHGVQSIRFRETCWVESQAIKNGDRLAFPSHSAVIAYHQAIKILGVWE